MERYKDRQEAGLLLSECLKKYKDTKNTLVLALPRGGVPVAYEVATALHLPLDVFIVRKLGFPGHEEYAMGAIAPGGVLFLNNETSTQDTVSRERIDHVLKEERKELARRERLYRGNKAFPDLHGKTVLLIDDGIATGASLQAAILSLKTREVGRIVVAVPVAPLSTVEFMKELVDELVCPLQPENFSAVGLWYDNFSQTSDEEVLRLLS